MDAKKSKINYPTIILEYETKTFSVELIQAKKICTLSKKIIFNSIKIHRDAKIHDKYYLRIIYPSEYHIQYNQVGEILFVEVRMQPVDIMGCQTWAEPTFMTREIPMKKTMKRIRLIVSSDIY